MKHTKLGVKEIGEYYNTAHFLRPINREMVEEYAKYMHEGAVFPPVILGEYTGMDGQPARLIVDGVQRFRAAQLAEVKKLAVEVRTYPALADALAEQLKLNARHGFRLTVEERDIRIRLLNDVYGWQYDRIAAVVGLSASSVGRIVKGEQNLSGTGKPGPRTGSKRTVELALPVSPHSLSPKSFIRSVENLYFTVSKSRSKKAILRAIQDPKVARSKPKVISLIKNVIAEFQQLLKLAIKTERQEEEETDSKKAA